MKYNFCDGLLFKFLSLQSYAPQLLQKLLGILLCLYVYYVLVYSFLLL